MFITFLIMRKYECHFSNILRNDADTMKCIIVGILYSNFTTHVRSYLLVYIVGLETGTICISNKDFF